MTQTVRFHLLAAALVFTMTVPAYGQLSGFTEEFTLGTPQTLTNPTVSVSVNAGNTVAPTITGGTVFEDPAFLPDEIVNLDADLLGDGVSDGHIILDVPAGNAGSSTPGINFVIGTITADDVGATISLDAAVFQAGGPTNSHATQIAFLIDSDGNDNNDSVLGVEFNPNNSDDFENFFSTNPNLALYPVAPVVITEDLVGSSLSVRFELFNNAIGNRDLGIDTIQFNVEPAGVGLPCDVNLDGSVDFLDISPFVDALTSSTFVPSADCDGNGLVNFLDIAPFIAALAGA